MRVRATRAIVLALVLATSAVAADDRSKPAIGDLGIERRDGGVQVSFRVTDGFSEEALERIHSGIPVRFRHKIELVTRRWFPLMPSKVLARAVIETTAEYDALTKRYALTRRVELRGGRKKQSPPPEVQEESTTSTDEMRVWMTEVRDVPVIPVRVPDDARLKVRVDSTVGRRYVMLIFPSRVVASTERRLEP